jgi:hypothetical protein
MGAGTVYKVYVMLYRPSQDLQIKVCGAASPAKPALIVLELRYSVRQFRVIDAVSAVTHCRLQQRKVPLACLLLRMPTRDRSYVLIREIFWSMCNLPRQ